MPRERCAPRSAPGSTGSASVDFWDAERNQRVSLGDRPDGPSGLAVWDGFGRLRSLLAVGPDGERDGSLEFWDADGAYRAGFGTWPDGGTGAELLDASGALRGRIGQRGGEGAPAVELYDEAGRFVAALAQYPDGSGRLSLWDAAAPRVPLCDRGAYRSLSPPASSLRTSAPAPTPRFASRPPECSSASSNAHQVPSTSTTPSWRRPRSGVTLHTRRLPRDETTVRLGIPVTTTERTLLDLATVLREPQLRRALHEAEVQRATTHTRMAAFLEGHTATPGAPKFRRLLAHGPAPTRSELEDRLRELILSCPGIPAPQFNVRVEGFEVDLLFREHRVIVEADGARFHDTPTARAQDQEKQAVLEVAGYRVIRVTWSDVVDHPSRTLRRLLRALA